MPLPANKEMGMLVIKKGCNTSFRTTSTKSSHLIPPQDCPFNFTSLLHSPCPLLSSASPVSFHGWFLSSINSRCKVERKAEIDSLRLSILRDRSIFIHLSYARACFVSTGPTFLYVSEHQVVACRTVVLFRQYYAPFPTESLRG